MGKQGFTLLELMVVIAIFAIIALAAAPRFETSKTDFKLRTTARNCVSDIRYAQQLSMDKKEKHKILFNTEGYEITNLDVYEIVKTVKFVGVTYEKTEDESGYEIGDETGYKIVFDSEGKPLAQDEMMTLTELTEKSKIFLKAGAMYIYVYVTPSTGEVSFSWK